MWRVFFFERGVAWGVLGLGYCQWSKAVQKRLSSGSVGFCMGVKIYIPKNGICGEGKAVGKQLKSLGSF